MWERRGSFLITTDAGRSWRALAVSRPEVVEAVSVSFVSERVGFALFRRPDGVVLEYTAEGGSKWTKIRLWRGAR